MVVVKNGLIEYTSLERYLMREKGVCITCDTQETCSIRTGNLDVMANWKIDGDCIEIIVRSCSIHKVQGIKTFGVRGK